MSNREEFIARIEADLVQVVRDAERIIVESIECRECGEPMVLGVDICIGCYARGVSDG